MSVVTVSELWDGRRGLDGIERKREYTRRFEVIVDDANDDATVAGGPTAGVLGLPRNGEPYPNDPDAVMVSIAPEVSSESPYIWYVSCEYSSEIPNDLAAESQTIDPTTGDSMPTSTAPGADQGAAAEGRDPNPVNWEAVYKIAHEQTQEICTHDKDGNPLVNSAGDPFFPPIMVERSYAIITVIKNYANVKFDYLETYGDTVNLVRWNGRAPRTCRLLAIEYEKPEQTNGFSYWRVTFRIKYKPGEWDGGRENDVGQGWDMRLVDQGFRARHVVNVGPPIVYQYVDFADPRTGEKPTLPILLNGVGGFHANIVGIATSDPPAYVTFEIYKRREWAGLGL